MSVTTEQELKEYLDKKFEKFEQQFDKIDERLNRLEIGQAEIKGEIKALEAKVDGISKRLDSQEFVSRGVLVGLIIAIAGGAAKLFGLVGNP
jgi:uncharacterized protein (DUF849 family)